MTVSPRSASKAEKLAAAFPDRVRIGADNQAVVDASDVVFIGLLPDVAEAVLPELKFRDDQLIISMMATKRHEEVVALTRMPADKVVVSVPLPSASKRTGPVLMYPPHPGAEAIYSTVSTPVVLGVEADMHTILPFTAMISPFYQLQETCASWAESRGADKTAAGKYVGAFFASLAAASKGYPEEGFGGMAEEAATPGGLNEQTVRELKERGSFGHFADALDSILKRIAPERFDGGDGK